MRLIRNKFLAVVISLIGLGVGQLYGQSALDLRINEVLVYNDSNYVDDFGVHSPWIEIFNSAYNTVDIGGLYLTDDLSQPMKYPIFKGQPITQIPPRSYIVFWADDKPTRGILHLNFTLEAGKTIALFDANGRTLVDSVTIPHSVIRDVTYGRLVDGGAEWGNLDKSTPNADNDTSVKVLAGDEFARMDPTGLGMAAIAMTVVFLALALLSVFFKYMGKVMSIDIKKQLEARAAAKARAGVQAVVGEEEASELELTGELNAAIAMTLYLYATELHDAENTVLTINRVSRTYSPWSSKIYGLRKFPN
ncbi:MAG TPA: OadG family transporter subunit [Prolixibacteraceae bacterium]|nr:OadG family transporter subunit [Prolixibacteraceae bacterium]